MLIINNSTILQYYHIIYNTDKSGSDFHNLQNLHTMQHAHWLLTGQSTDSGATFSNKLPEAEMLQEMPVIE